METQPSEDWRDLRSWSQPVLCEKLLAMKKEFAKVVRMRDNFQSRLQSLSEQLDERRKELDNKQMLVDQLKSKMDRLLLERDDLKGSTHAVRSSGGDDQSSRVGMPSMGNDMLDSALRARYERELAESHARLAAKDDELSVAKRSFDTKKQMLEQELSNSVRDLRNAIVDRQNQEQSYEDKLRYLRKSSDELKSQRDLNEKLYKDLDRRFKEERSQLEKERSAHTLQIVEQALLLESLEKSSKETIGKMNKQLEQMQKQMIEVRFPVYSIPESKDEVPQEGHLFISNRLEVVVSFASKTYRAPLDSITPEVEGGVVTLATDYRGGHVDFRVTSGKSSLIGKLLSYYKLIV